MKSEDLQSEAQDSGETARSIRVGAEDSDSRLDDIGAALVRASDGLGDVSGHSTSLQKSMTEFENLTHGLRSTFRNIADGTQAASARMGHLIDGSEEILRLGVALGANVTDAPFIEFVQINAEKIKRIFETALARGDMSEQELFDETYRPIAGTNPEQCMTGFTAFTDLNLPPIQETCFDLDPRVVFCAAVDRNGYLPTHNIKFSHEQKDDVVWNTANCRNRRIFDDRVGLKAGQSENPFILQVYRRDMGGGRFALMKDVSAPIVVRNRHWGGLRMGYTMS